MKPMPGESILHYRILEKLGEGGMGVVYRAEDTKLKRVVALKFLPASLGAESEEVSRFLHEAQAISSLNHPHIATIHSLEESGDQRFIVLEYLEGGTLREKLKERQVGISDAVEWAIQIAEGLSYAHRREIVHRDVKTDNVMLSAEGKLKLTDFGLAKLKGLSRVTRTGSTIGTAAYMSPEQARGEDVDYRSDIFSLGVVLYEIITGALPFKGEHEAALIYEIVHEHPRALHDLRSDVPDVLQRIVDRAMEKDLTRRYQNLGEMLNDLKGMRETVASGMGSSNPLVRATRRTLLRVRRKTPWLISIAGLLLIGLAVLLFRVFSPPGRISVAVLPFDITGVRTDDNAATAFGIAQSIVTRLTKLKNVKVTAWVTSQRFQGNISSPEDLRAAASSLGVERLIIGTIRTVGDRVHVDAGLIDSTATQQLWAEQLDANAAEIFALQSKIALGCAAILKGGLSGEEETLVAKPPSERADAYEFFVKGSLKMQLGTQEDDNMALALFDRSVVLDPGLADAFVGRGAVFGNRFFFGWGGSDALDSAIQNYQRALAIDPQSTSARRGLIWELSEFGRSDEVFRQMSAVRGEPSDNIDALSIKADAYFAGGLPDRAAPIYERILHLERANQSALWHLVIALTWSCKAQEAIDAGERYFDQFGDDPEMHQWVAVAHEMLGDLDAARVHFDRALALFGENSTEYADLYAARFYKKIGDTTKAYLILNGLDKRLEKKLREYPTNFRMNCIRVGCNAHLGKLDQVKKLLRSSVKMLFSTDDLWPTLLLLLKVNENEYAGLIMEDISRSGNDILWALKMSRALGYVDEEGWTLFEKSGFLKSQTDLDNEYRRLY